MSLTIEQAKAKHQSRLLTLPGVVSVGIGRGAQGKPVIVVGLDGAHPEASARVPMELDGHPVRVEIIGPVSAQ